MTAVQISSNSWFSLLESKVSEILHKNDQTLIENINFRLYLKHERDVKSRVGSIIKESYEEYDDNDCNIMLLQHNSSWQLLQGLQWPHVYRVQSVEAINDIISTKIKSICEEASFDDPTIEVLEEWLQSSLLPFVNQLFLHPNSQTQTSSFLPQLLTDLHTHSLHVLMTQRSSQFFDMILDYPDSSSALLELKTLFIPHLPGSLGSMGISLRTALQKRLLHLGASTHQILDVYISLMKVCRLVDGSDVLLNFVAMPVRSYLKARPDAIRCILSALTTDGGSELYGELKKAAAATNTATTTTTTAIAGSAGTAAAAAGPGAATGGSSSGGTAGSLFYGGEGDDHNDAGRDNGGTTAAGGSGGWQPRPRVPDFTRSLLTSQQQQQQPQHEHRKDILATLVSLYGSTDLFIIEYRAMLASKVIYQLSTIPTQPAIVASSGAGGAAGSVAAGSIAGSGAGGGGVSKYKTDTDVMMVELLKIRFGEDSLHHCEVILKDVEDSKRTMTAIRDAIGRNNKEEEKGEKAEEAAKGKAVVEIAKAMDWLFISDQYWPASRSLLLPTSSSTTAASTGTGTAAATAGGIGGIGTSGEDEEDEEEDYTQPAPAAAASDVPPAVSDSIAHRQATRGHYYYYHPSIATSYQEVISTYHTLKKPRLFTPLSTNCETVALTLTFNDGSEREFTGLTALQANTILYLGELLEEEEEEKSDGGSKRRGISLEQLVEAMTSAGTAAVAGNGSSSGSSSDGRLGYPSNHHVKRLNIPKLRQELPKVIDFWITKHVLRMAVGNAAAIVDSDESVVAYYEIIEEQQAYITSVLNKKQKRQKRKNAAKKQPAKEEDDEVDEEDTMETEEEDAEEDEMEKEGEDQEDDSEDNDDDDDEMDQSHHRHQQQQLDQQQHHLASLQVTARSWFASYILGIIRSSHHRSSGSADASAGQGQAAAAASAHGVTIDRLYSLLQLVIRAAQESGSTLPGTQITAMELTQHVPIMQSIQAFHRFLQDHLIGSQRGQIEYQEETGCYCEVTEVSIAARQVQQAAAASPS